MVIGNHDYHFAYTVGAYLAMMDMNIDKQSRTYQSKQIVHLAVAMSKGYEDREKLNNPDYEVKYLTLDDVYSLPVSALAELSKEVDAAFREGNEITVKTQSRSKKK